MIISSKAKKRIMAAVLAFAMIFFNVPATALAAYGPPDDANVTEYSADADTPEYGEAYAKDDGDEPDADDYGDEAYARDDGDYGDEPDARDDGDEAYAEDDGGSVGDYEPDAGYENEDVSPPPVRKLARGRAVL